MRRSSLSLLTVLALAASSFATPASADAGAQFATVGYQAPRDPNVNGIRFALIHGVNDSVRGLDMGILSLSETGSLSGAALILGLCKLNGDMEGGLAWSMINVHEGRDTGFNAAFINKLNEPANAVDLAFVNIADGMSMLDLGGLNVSKRSNAQLGFINVTEEIRGFQFGLLNIAQNGFLPVFPIVNFPVGPPSSSP